MMAQMKQDRQPYSEIMLKRNMQGVDKTLKQQVKDFKKDEMNRTLFTRIFYYLKISSMKVTVISYEIKWRYKVRVFNPWNPLTYLIIAVLFIPSVLQSGIPITLICIGENFKYRLFSPKTPYKV